MAVEIERKFLLTDERWRADVVKSVTMHQGYLGSDPRCSVRVRRAGDAAWLNIKGATLGIERLEFEYAIAPDDAETMLQHLCGPRTLSKTRHLVPHGGHTWEIDEFDGDNRGLIVAEIELAHVDEPFARPAWLGDEVSADPRYYNVCLIDNPYTLWDR